MVVKQNILPDIRYPAFGLDGYPAKTVQVSGASLVIRGEHVSDRLGVIISGGPRCLPLIWSRKTRLIYSTVQMR
jgi:hypothetical protein